MSLKEFCEKGEIGIEELVRIMQKDFPVPIRSQWLLRKGDYALVGNPLVNEKIVRLERVEEIDYLERGDFLTENGTFGPIQGNVFIQLSDDSPHGYRLLEGDDVCWGNGSVYDQMRDYFEGKVPVLV